MMRIVTAAALALALGSSTFAAPPAAAQEIPPELKNDMVDIEYNEPTSAKYMPIYQRLKERKLLEQLAAFLSPLKLQGALVLSLEEGDPQACKGPNSYYDMAGKLHLCYSWFYYLENEVSKDVARKPNEPFTATSLGLIPGFTRAEVIIGGSVGVILHELGHALFDIQDIPLFGREEDGADQIASLLMLQFGKEVALTTIKGFYNVWHHSNAERLIAQKGQIKPYQEADEHSLDIQRAYNILCMAYGKDSESFQDLADRLLPRIRKASCADEYKQVANAFRKTVLPDVDPDLMKKVLQMQILRPEDFKR
jgi:Putative metallopeptidase